MSRVTVEDGTAGVKQTKVEMMSETECALLELLKDLARGIPSSRLAGSGDTAYLPKVHIKEILATAGYAPDFVEAVDDWEGPVDACLREASEEIQDNSTKTCPNSHQIA